MSNKPYECNTCHRKIFNTGGHLAECPNDPFRVESHQDYDDHLFYQGMTDADFKDMVHPDEGDK